MHTTTYLPNGVLLTLIIPLVILELILLLVALIDLIRRDPARVNGNKFMWAIIIIVIGTIGPILYLILGRKGVTKDDERS